MEKIEKDKERKEQEQVKEKLGEMLNQVISDVLILNRSRNIVIAREIVGNVVEKIVDESKWRKEREDMRKEKTLIQKKRKSQGNSKYKESYETDADPPIEERTPAPIKPTETPTTTDRPTETTVQEMRNGPTESTKEYSEKEHSKTTTEEKRKRKRSEFQTEGEDPRTYPKKRKYCLIGNKKFERKK